MCNCTAFIELKSPCYLTSVWVNSPSQHCIGSPHGSLSPGGRDHRFNPMESCQCGGDNLPDLLRRSACTIYTVCSTLLGRGNHRKLAVQHPRKGIHGMRSPGVCLFEGIIPLPVSWRERVFLRSVLRGICALQKPPRVESTSSIAEVQYSVYPVYELSRMTESCYTWQKVQRYVFRTLNA